MHFAVELLQNERRQVVVNVSRKRSEFQLSDYDTFLRSTMTEKEFLYPGTPRDIFICT